MQLIDYVTVLRRRWWVILLVGLVSSTAAYGFSKLQTPVYRSESTYQVVSNYYSNELLVVLQGKMNGFRALALAPQQLEKISSNLQLDRSADWLLQRVRVQPKPDEQLMTVQVDYPEDPAKAQEIADAVGRNMIALVSAQNSTIEGTNQINVVELQPARYIGRVKPTTSINVLAGGVLGLILGLLLAFLLEALDNTLKTPSDVERFVGLTTLGTIPAINASRPSRDEGRRAKDERRPIHVK